MKFSAKEALELTNNSRDNFNVQEIESLVDSILVDIKRQASEGYTVLHLHPKCSEPIKMYNVARELMDLGFSVEYNDYFLHLKISWEKANKKELLY